MCRLLRTPLDGCCVRWMQRDEDVTVTTAKLRAALPGWAVFYDPWLAVWVAVRGRRILAVGSAPSKLLARADAAWRSAVSDANELTAALTRRGVAALPAGDAVRAWINGAGSGYLLITPEFDHGEKVWRWEHRAAAGTHPRGDAPGAAQVIAALLKADPP